MRAHAHSRCDVIGLLPLCIWYYLLLLIRSSFMHKNTINNRKGKTVAVYTSGVFGLCEIRRILCAP